MTDKNDAGAELTGQTIPEIAEIKLSPTSHTPGPWKAVNRPYTTRAGERRDDWRVEGARGDELVELYASDGADEPTSFPSAANAHLIAAAPELYAVLKQSERAIQSLDIDALGESGTIEDTWPLRDELLHYITAALAKAEGR